MPGYSRVPRGRYASPVPGSRGPRFDGNEPDIFFEERDARSSSAKRKPTRRKKRPGKYAAKRSRDFIEGQLYERDRMDGYREPPQPAEGNYADRRFGPLRVGYRS